MLMVTCSRSGSVFRPVVLDITLEALQETGTVCATGVKKTALAAVDRERPVKIVKWATVWSARYVLSTQLVTMLMRFSVKW